MKQLSLFPELDLKSDEPLQVDHSTNTLFNKMVEKPVRKPNATPPKTKTIKVPASNGGVIKPKEKPKVRAEDFNERLERMIYQYEGTIPKPKHYDNPNIIDAENLGKKPKPFNNNDPSTYPSDKDQKQRLSSWDLILDQTIKSGTAREKKEMRKYLKDKYKDPVQRKLFTEKEKRFISEYKAPEVTIPKVDTTFLTQNFKPIEQTIEQKIRDEQFQKLLDDQKKAEEDKHKGLAYLLGV